MSNLADALREKITLLEDEEEELRDALSRIVAKKEALSDLLAEEEGDAPASAFPKKRGRPKGSKNKTTPKKAAPKKAPETEEEKALREEEEALREEASKMEGTPPEVAERLRNRPFNPAPRPSRDLGPGITAGPKKDVLGSSIKSDRTISIEDDE